MGISSLQSYRGAQVFEALGLRQDVIDDYFTCTPSRVGGIGLDVIAQEVLRRHCAAYRERPATVTRSTSAASTSGAPTARRIFSRRSPFTPAEGRAQRQLFPVQGVRAAHQRAVAVRAARCAACSSSRPATPMPLEEVEPVEEIMKRFKTGAMSYGSISSGGARDARHRHEPHRRQVQHRRGRRGSATLRADCRTATRSNSAIKQVASGRFGVTSEYLVNARELQIKMAQGAKPGEGGQLPGTKVYPWIAKTRYSTPGVGLISPPPHHDVYSIEDLAQLIHDLKNGNRHARISVKLVAEVGVGTVAAGVAKAHADVVLISGHDGGTGASPQTSLRHAGLPWELGLAETHQTLLLNNLRSRIAVEVDGQLKTGRDVLIAALLGRRGVRLRDRAARGHRLHPDAGVPSQHLPGRHRHAGSAAAREVRRQARARRQFHAVHRAGDARAHGGARLPQARGDDRPRRPARSAQGRRALEGQGAGFLEHPVRAGRRRGYRALPADGAGSRPGQVARCDVAASRSARRRSSAARRSMPNCRSATCIAWSAR